MKVLYDLDGIICPDYKGSLLEVLTYRKNALPAYNPNGRFSILTGRPIEDTPDTLFWLCCRPLKSRTFSTKATPNKSLS